MQDRRVNERGDAAFCPLVSELGTRAGFERSFLRHFKTRGSRLSAPSEEWTARMPVSMSS